MRCFTKIITESSASSTTIDRKEWDAYRDAIEQTKRSKEFTHLMWLMDHEDELHTDADTFNKIISGRTVANVSKDTIKDITRIMSKIGHEAKLLPQFLTAAQRESIISKRVDANDYTLDLESQKGRNEIAKRYARLVEKMVNQFINGKNCILSKEELRSSAYYALAQAMDEYKNPDEMAKLGKSSSMSFTTYLAQRIRHQILTDMTTQGRNVEVSNYFQKKNAEAGVSNYTEISLDNLAKNDDDDRAMSIDRFLELSEEPDDWTGDRKKTWDRFCKALEAKFSLRLCTMLYRIWGVNGYEPEKAKDLAKEYNVSKAAISQSLKRMFDWAKTSPEGRECLALFENAYVCNRIIDLYDKPKETIVAEFLSDDVYLLFEAANRWSDKNTYINSVNRATDGLSADDAVKLFKYFNNAARYDELAADASLKFLSNMYPDKRFSKNDMTGIKNSMEELKATSAQHKIKW